VIGKLIGKVVGEVIALPITVAKEGEKAISEATKTVERKF
jgi:hypothetical protein